jgi:hypothetical protein
VRAVRNAVLVPILMLLLGIRAVHAEPRTYCNPMNLDYAYAPRRDAHGPNSAHRSTADPVCVMYRGRYFLVSTNQEGYWISDDLLGWTFVPHLFKANGNHDNVCAPAAWPTRHGLLFLPCFADNDVMPLYRSTDPARGAWSEAVPAFPLKTWDPSIFEDRDDRLYLYWGSSNFYPLHGVELDPSSLLPAGEPRDLIRLNPGKHGWERFGEDNQQATMDPFIEGAWMNRFGDRYYLQYAAPGTEWNVYGDGVYVSSGPLGPFVYQEHNPFSWKPTGFIRGAGHGSTFADRYGNLWHVATMVVSVKHKFERRLGLFPAGVDGDGVLFCDTGFGDYPHFVPRGRHDPHGDFTGWMLLSYRKPCAASASRYPAGRAFDEDVKTYWSAPDNAPGQWLSVDLGGPRQVRAIQVSFAEEQATLYGKQAGIHHRYRILGSDDGKSWRVLVDKSRNERDVPHDYVEVRTTTRFVRVENVEMPTGCFAIGDLRVFGRAAGARPARVEALQVRRGGDRRDAALSWTAVPGAYAYEVRFGVRPDKLYTSFLVYGATRYDLHALNVDSPYWFTVRAVGETGLGKASALSPSR